MSTFNCAEFCLKSNVCSQMVSSNGHSTWCTPLYTEDNWDIVCNYDLEGIHAPYVNESGKPSCNGFEPSVNFHNQRPCQCGSGQAWVECGENSDYCG